jgi:hypothetical protein
MLQMIVSNGNNGAAYAGLVAAHDLGIRTGGIAPKGYTVTLYDKQQVPNRLLESKFGLAENDNYCVEELVRRNIFAACGTVWFGNQETEEKKITYETAFVNDKPIVINPSAQKLAEFVVNNNIKVLNIAGNITTSNNRDIYSRTYITVYEALIILISNSQCCIINNTISLDILTNAVMDWFKFIVEVGFENNITEEQGQSLHVSLQECIRNVVLTNRKSY